MSLRRQLLSRFRRKQPIFFPPQKHAYLLTTTAALQYAILKCARSFREASEESNLENCENCLSWSCCSKQGLKMGQGKLKATRISSCGCATRNLPALMVRLKQKTFCRFSLWLPVGAVGGLSEARETALLLRGLGHWVLPSAVSPSWGGSVFFGCMLRLCLENSCLLYNGVLSMSNLGTDWSLLKQT